MPILTCPHIHDYLKHYTAALKWDGHPVNFLEVTFKAEQLGKANQTGIKGPFSSEKKLKVGPGKIK